VKLLEESLPTRFWGLHVVFVFHRLFVWIVTALHEDVDTVCRHTLSLCVRLAHEDLCFEKKKKRRVERTKNSGPESRRGVGFGSRFGVVIG
jgi:hypothetical protein